MSALARKPKGEAPMKEGRQGKSVQNNDRRRNSDKKGSQPQGRDDRQQQGAVGHATADGLPPSPARGVPTRDGRGPMSKAIGLESPAGQSQPGAQRGARQQTGPQGQSPHNDVDMSEVKVMEDQLLTEAGEFVCKICQIYVVGRSPKLTQCSHLFCGDCLAQWFSRQPVANHGQGRATQARIAPCPVCKTSLDESQLSKVGVGSGQSVMSRMLASLKICCSNHSKVRPDGTCEWTGCYADYKKHIAGCGCCEQPPQASEVVSAAPVLPPLSSMPDIWSLTPPSPPSRPPSSTVTAAAPLAVSQGGPPQQPAAASTPASGSHDICQAHSAFDAAGPEMVQIRLGDYVQLLSSLPTGWAYCQNLTTSQTGWAPSWVVQPKVAEEVSTASLDVGGGQSACFREAPQPPQPEQRSYDIMEVKAAFTGADSSQLTLSPGDRVEVIERNASGWSYACVLPKPGVPAATPLLEGWFPHWACEQTVAQRQRPMQTPGHWA